MAHVNFSWAIRLFLAGLVTAAHLGAEFDMTSDFRSVLAGDVQHGAMSLLQVHARGPSKVGSQKVEEADKLPADKRVIWISAFPRSGSSMMLSLVSQADFPVFTIFEPCHVRDSLEPWLTARGCGALLSQLSQCNFTGVIWLNGWLHGQTLKNGAGGKPYTPQRAAKACRSAGLVAFKTVTWGHDLAKETIPFLEANPHVQAIDLIRDPRSIYASEFNAGGFWKGIHDPDPEELTEMCDYMSDGLYETHPRLLRVVYEDFIVDPVRATGKISDFVAIPPELGAYNHSAFLNWSFDNEDCNDDNAYSNCQTNRTAPIDRYTLLGERMFRAFSGTKHCREISKFYGYDPWYGVNHIVPYRTHHKEVEHRAREKRSQQKKHKQVRRKRSARRITAEHKKHKRGSHQKGVRGSTAGLEAEQNNRKGHKNQIWEERAAEAREDGII